ncbi:MAG: PKD domain-containing protein [Sphingobacteriaceae bacterium]|nr:PKD domain-containing protein [Sphingobacteriaceae bacterium]
MKLYTKKLIFAVAFCLSMINLNAQTAYSEDFENGAPGTCNTTFPTTPTIWTSATSDWVIDDNVTSCSGGVPECTVTSSSGGSMLAGGDNLTNLEAAVSASFTTGGLKNIVVDWNEYRTSTPKSPDITIEYSFDNITYTVVPGWTDIVADDNWHAIPTLALPADCDAQTTIYLRWSYTGDGTGSFMAIDDIIVSGTPSPIYYWNGGAPHDKTSWGLNADGTGGNPTDFVTANQTFNFYNNTTNNFSPTLSADWAVSGGTVVINVGDGATRLTNFTIPPTFSLSISGATLRVLNSSTLTLQNTVTPTGSLVSLSAGSTIDFAQTSTVTLYPKAYSNLTISGGANKLHGGSPTSVSGVLNLSSAASNYSMATSLQTMTLSGTCVGTGSLLTGNSSITILGSGAFGTLNFGSGSTANQIRNLTINRTGGGVVTLGSDLRVNGTALFTAGSLVLNDKTLGCNGAITFPASIAQGNISGSTASSFTVGGTGAISNSLLLDQTSATTRALRDLTLSRATTTLTLGNPLEIWGSLTPTVGTFAAGSGNVTLKSSSTLKGRIGRMGASGDFTGTNVTVETLASGGTTGYTNLGAAGISSKTFADWNDEFAITCPTCPDGSVVGSTPFTSITAYNESAFSGDFGNAAHYVDIANVTDAIGTGKGWWVYLGSASLTTSDIQLDVTGSINKGNLSNIPLTVTGGASAQNGWNLLANPYPSPISFTAVINGNTGNCENTLYVWNPDLNGGNGDFAIFTPSVGSVPAVGSGGVNDNIPTGQGFYIRATSAFNLSPTESWKSATASTNALLKTNAVASYPPSLFILNLTGGGTKNFNTMTAININPAATAGFDNTLDATHLSPGYGIAEISSVVSNVGYKINSIPTVNGTVSIPVKVISGTSGAYQIAPLNINNLPAGACVTLFDRFTNTTHDLRTSAYSFNFVDTTSVYRFVLNISVNQTALNSTSSNAACTKNPNGKIIASGTTTGPWNYVWKDVQGNIIKTTNNLTTADTLKNLGAGDYFVDVTTVGSCDNANGEFNIVVSSPLPVAAFTSSADSIDINSSTPFVFTNASVNASNYTWYFGDGNTSTAVSPTYTYATPGNYDVSLYALNPACADSSFSIYTIKVYGTATSPTLQSVASIVGADNNIKIGKDANGIYVQFNYDKNTRGTVTVTNVLGQILIAPKTIEGTTERFYIDVNVKDQLLFVTVATGEKRITERLLSTQ